TRIDDLPSSLIIVHSRWIYSERGGITFDDSVITYAARGAHPNLNSVRDLGPRWRLSRLTLFQDAPPAGTLGFLYVAERSHRTIRVPHWLPVLITSIPILFMGL